MTKNNEAPPTTDEVLAFFDGRLEGAEEERVRRLLAAYPELARAGAAELPSPDETADLSDVELARDWESLQSKIRPRSRSKWLPRFAIAASLALVFVAGFELGMKRSSREPLFIDPPQLILPLGARGSDAATELPRNTDEFVLQLPVINQPAYPDYRITILALPDRVIRSSRGIRRHADDTFELRLSRALLAPGTYRLIIEGVDGTQAQRIGAYGIRVPER